MFWLIVVLSFILNLSVAIWFIRYLSIRRDRVKKRIFEIEKQEWQETEETPTNSKEIESRGKLSFIIWRVLSKIKLIRIIEEKLQGELKKANILMKSNELIMLIFVSSLIGVAIGILLTGGDVDRGMWLGLVTWVMPLIWLNGKKKSRKRKLEGQLTEMINMTANSLKAGYSLIQALELLSREMAAPLSEEIQRMLQEMRLGVSTEHALRNFNYRVDSPDLDLIITAMLIQRQVGGNLAEILDTIGDTIRERIRLKGEVKALTAQGRMSMIIFMLLPVALAGFLSLTNPEYMKTLIIHPIGWFMIILAIIGQFIGAVIIRKIVEIEV